MQFKINKLVSALALLTFIFSGQVFADDSAVMDMVRDMQKKMEDMQKTINAQDQKIRKLESREPQIQVSPSAGAEASAPMSDYEFNERLAGSLGGANKWLKDLSFKGDLRLRYEAFQNTSGATTETDDRNRFRYRLRYGFEKKFNEDMQAGFSMASGEATNNIDPTSTNTTFDNNFAFKNIFIEKAYARYAPPFLRGYGPLTKTTITAGKMDNGFEKGSSDIIWDRDVKPEGALETFDFKLIDGSSVDVNSWVNLGQFVLDEDGTAPGDANLFAYQLGLNTVLYTPVFERPVDWTSAFSIYNFNGYGQNSNFLANGTSLARGNPNTLGNPLDLDTGNFQVYEIYNEIAFYPFGLPVRPFFDIAHNTRNELVSGIPGGIGTEEDNAWALGVKLGGIVKKGDWEVSYAHKNIEANAVPGFNDSDFGNAGHSGRAGEVFKAVYALTDTISVGGAAFFVHNLNNGTGGILDEEQRRFQMDLIWKF